MSRNTLIIRLRVNNKIYALIDYNPVESFTEPLHSNVFYVTASSSLCWRTAAKRYTNMFFNLTKERVVRITIDSKYEIFAWFDVTDTIQNKTYTDSFFDLGTRISQPNTYLLNVWGEIFIDIDDARYKQLWISQWCPITATSICTPYNGADSIYLHMRFDRFIEADIFNTVASTLHVENDLVKSTHAFNMHIVFKLPVAPLWNRLDDTQTCYNIHALLPNITRVLNQEYKMHGITWQLQYHAISNDITIHITNFWGLIQSNVKLVQKMLYIKATLPKLPTLYLIYLAQQNYTMLKKWLIVYTQSQIDHYTSQLNDIWLQHYTKMLEPLDKTTAICLLMQFNTA